MYSIHGMPTLGEICEGRYAETKRGTALQLRLGKANTRPVDGVNRSADLSPLAE